MWYLSGQAASAEGSDGVDSQERRVIGDQDIRRVFSPPEEDDCGYKNW